MRQCAIRYTVDKGVTTAAPICSASRQEGGDGCRLFLYEFLQDQGQLGMVQDALGG